MWYRFALWSLILAGCLPAIALATAPQTDTLRAIELGDQAWLAPHARVMLDPLHLEHPADIAAAGDALLTVTPAGRALSLGVHPDKVVWILFQVEGDSLSRWLRLNEVVFDDVRLFRHPLTGHNAGVSASRVAWTEVDRALETTRAGQRTPAWRPTYALELAPGETALFALRIHSGQPLRLAPRLLTSTGRAAADRTLMLGQGLYLGVVGGLAIYNLFLFFGLRDRRYLWYVGFILSTAAFFTTLNGLHLEWIPELSPGATGMLATTFLGLLAALALQFTRRFLGTAELDPRLDPWLKFGIAVPLAGIVLNVLVPEGIVVLYMSAMGLVTTTLFFTATLRAAVFRRFRPAYYMLAAWSVLILGILAFILAALGLAPHGLITYHGFQIGSAIEALLLSLALADRVRLLREEREQLAADHDRLHQATRTDPLTGLSNRRHLEEALPSEVQRATTGANGLALLIVDADHFKQYNDCYGHAQGDRLLEDIARTMRETVAPDDSIFRFGGEEFVILTRRPEQADRLAEQIRQGIEAGTAGRPESRVTVSIGVAALATGESPAHLFERADQALYAAKAAGRNRVAFDDT